MESSLSPQSEPVFKFPSAASLEPQVAVEAELSDHQLIYLIGHLEGMVNCALPSKPDGPPSKPKILYERVLYEIQARYKPVSTMIEAACQGNIEGSPTEENYFALAGLRAAVDPANVRNLK